MNIFFQRQIKSDLCRLYSINNYFGYDKLTEEAFYNYCDKYDSIIHGLKSRNMDGFAEGRSIINYIIDIVDNKFSLLIPLNNYNNSRVDINIEYYKKKILELDSYFEFNKGHIWVNKKIDNKWYKIDSISGINIINPIINNNGFILVFDKSNLFNEIDNTIIMLKNNNYNNEILYYNLFHSIKLINLDINLTNDIDFNNNLTIFKLIYKTLVEYIYYKRKLSFNKVNLDSIVTRLENSIKLI